MTIGQEIYKEIALKIMFNGLQSGSVFLQKAHRELDLRGISRCDRGMHIKEIGMAIVNMQN